MGEHDRSNVWGIGRTTAPWLGCERATKILLDNALPAGSEIEENAVGEAACLAGHRLDAVGLRVGEAGDRFHERYSSGEGTTGEATSDTATADTARRRDRVRCASQAARARLRVR